MGRFRICHCTTKCHLCVKAENQRAYMRSKKDNFEQAKYQARINELVLEMIEYELNEAKEKLNSIKSDVEKMEAEVEKMKSTLEAAKRAPPPEK